MTPAEQGQFPPPRVFISYSQHDPAQHSRRVREFAQALANDGLDVELDQYHQNESVDWPRWCEERLRPENSDFVLMICSAEYKNRIEGRVAADKGRGVFWEGGIIDDYLYEAKANERFIPILLDNENVESLPRIVRGWTWFKVFAFGIASGEVGYTNLYRLLTEQPGVVKPKPGERKVLPPELPSRPPLSHSPIKPTNLPYPSLGPLFKGREDFINGIRAGFAGNPGRAQAISSRQAVHGLGGIGKTRAAVEYAWRFAANYTALLFVSSETSLDFRANVAALCSILKIAEGISEDTVRFQAAIDWLRDPRHHGWLIIVDNLDTPEAADEAGKSLATLEGGHVLITGRLSEWPAFVESRRLDVLDRDAATEFLLARTADKRQPHENDAAEARALANELDGLALALEQAAAFIRRRTLSFAEYVQRWRAADQGVRQWHDARTMQYERPLAATWQTTIDMLPQGARSLLNLISWLAPEPLPSFLFDHSAVPEELKEFFEGAREPREILRILSGDSEADPELALASLRDFSLLQPAKEVRFRNEGQLHRVVALITRERQTAEQQNLSLHAALAMVIAGSVGDSVDVRSWPIWDPLRPHMRALVDAADQRAITEPTIQLMIGLARLLKTKARHLEAETLFRRALSISEKSFAPDHPIVFRILANLAQLLYATNRLEEAEPLMRQSLAIREKKLGANDAEIAPALNNLAQLLRATNRLAEAEPLYRRSLAIREKNFGADHPSVAVGLANLAQFLQTMKRTAEAEPLFRRALAINEKAFGPEHPTVATCLNNLGVLLESTNRLAEAEPLLRRVPEILEKAFGLEHPDVASALNNLAELLRLTNRRSEAEPLYRRALVSYKKSFGPDHPNVAFALNNLGLLLGALNRREEAEPLVWRNLVILLKFRRATGHMHPNFRLGLSNYISLLTEMNYPADEIRKQLLAAGTGAGFDEQSFVKLLQLVAAG